MLRSILIPLDGSSASERALPIAHRIAVFSGARLTLVHVHVPIINVTVGEWNLGGVPVVDYEMEAELRRREAAYLESLRARLAADKVMISCAVLDGPVAPALVEHAGAVGADLVVMTTHGHGAFSRVWLGSVADSFIRHSTVPTLLIRARSADEAAAPASDHAPRLQRMLIGLDGSELAERILEPAHTLGNVLGMEYWLVRVVDPRAVEQGYVAVDAADLEGEFVRPRQDRAHTYLDGIAAQLREHKETVHTHVIVAQQPARAILDAAQQFDIDLVALATHGRGGVPRLLLGSVADKVVRGAETPVLLLHPQEHAASNT